MPVDVVVVAYRSGAHLRACVEQLCNEPDLQVIVVDNACPERSTAQLEGLPVELVEMGRNAGFGAGCNAGARRGHGDAILFLNPDAAIAPHDVRSLAAVLGDHPSCAAVGPSILETNGDLQLSMRRAPRLLSAFGEAFFLHHLFRHAAWPTEIVRTGYDTPREVEWLSGAVICVRRTAFEELGGFDERLFLYSEDTDLCTRLRERGYVLRYEPSAVARHAGGGSAPRPSLVALKAEGRVTYARLHERRARYLGFRLAYAVHELLRVPLALVRSRSQARARIAALGVTLAGRDRWTAR
jgi:N-acetylglucosaminyl-diphospho-decaprenol L-rhamnosyltransferase